MPTPACPKSCDANSSYPTPFGKDNHRFQTAYALPDDEAQIRAEIFAHGPVTAGFNVYADWTKYTSGVYKAAGGQMLGAHAVRIIGWGVDAGDKYWLVANSFGSKWGDHGYFKIARGLGECGIEESVVAGLPHGQHGGHEGGDGAHAVADASTGLVVDPKLDPYQNDSTHYFPDCRPSGAANGALVCSQRPAAAGAIRVACVGDSITAVGHTSSKAHQYPSQLQDLLDTRHGNGTYSVTNLGTCGTTLQKDGAYPYWKSATYDALVGAVWDVVIIMLGTNDARDVGSGGPEHWPSAGCDHATAHTVGGCNFAEDYRSLLQIVKGLGRNATPPDVYIMVPPALMEQGAYGMNQTIINTVLPRLVPLIAAANEEVVKRIVNVYKGMGGVQAPAWRTELPPKCVLNSTWPPCRWYCDTQSCAPGQCHPNDVGCEHLAEVVYDGIWGSGRHGSRV